MNHECDKGEIIAVMKKQVDDLERVVFRGNGKKSLVDVVTEQKKDVESIEKNITSMSTAMRGINKFIDQETGGKIIWKNVTVIISLLIALGSLVTVIITT